MENEQSFFVKVFGDYPLIRVLDFLLTYREFDYSLTEIAKNANVGWSTIHQFFGDLVKLGVVRETRQVGRAKLYKLNEKNSIAQQLIKMDNKIIAEMSEKIIGKSKMVATS